MEKKKQMMVIPRKGIHTGESQPRAIYSETTDKIISALGKKETNRASHVEPTEELTSAAITWLVQNRDTIKIYPGQWWADMLPSGGPVLGPFNTRDEALHEEVKWLHSHGIPTCRTCADSQQKKSDDSSG